MSERFTAYRYILAQALAEGCWIGVADPVLHQLDDDCSFRLGCKLPAVQPQSKELSS